MQNPLKTTKKKAARWSWGVQDFFWGIAPLLLGAQLLAWIYFLPQSLHGHTSFRQLYTAGYMVRTGHSRELYDYTAQKLFQDQLVSHESTLMPFIRPPFDALVFVPFSFLSYPSAYIAFLILNFALLAASVRLLRSWTGNLRADHKWLPIAIFASFVPVASALILGQDSILLLALLSASMLALERERDFTAGTLAGLGLFKFHLLIPLALLLLCWRRFRFFTGFSTVAATLGLISIWIAHPSQLRVYAGSLLGIGKGDNGSANELLRYPLPITMMANVHGLVSGLFGNLPSFSQTIVTILLAAGVIVWIAIAVPRACPPQWTISIALTASVLASYYLFVYDLTILLLPLSVALNWSTSPSRVKMGRLLSVASVLVFLAPACMFFLPSYFYLVSLPLFFFLFVLVKSAENECSNDAAAAHS
jgi:Glycosyltransferase family 87